MTYQVKTKKFQGPLDLLLQLIEERKLPITEFSLAEVTQQFLLHIKSLGEINPNILADFLTIASKLLVIKSKALLPSLEEDIEDIEEGGLTLADQLTLYKKFKAAAQKIRTMEAKNNYMYERESSTQVASFFPDPAISPNRLRSAMLMVAKTLEEIIRLPKHVVKEVISIAEKIKHLQAALSEKIEFKLSEAIKNKDKTETIVTFLALLEMIKQKILTVDQESLFSEIKVRKHT